MWTAYHLTQRKTRNLLDQLMGLKFSVGAISQVHGKVAAALKVPVAQAVDSLGQAKALWMDETHYPRQPEFVIEPCHSCGRRFEHAEFWPVSKC